MTQIEEINAQLDMMVKVFGNKPIGAQVYNAIATYNVAKALARIADCMEKGQKL